MRTITDMIKKRNEKINENASEKFIIPIEVHDHIKEVIVSSAEKVINKLSEEALNKEILNLYLNINCKEFNTKEVTLFEEIVKINKLTIFKLIKGLSTSNFNTVIREIVESELGCSLVSINYRSNDIIISLVNKNEPKQ